MLIFAIQFGSVGFTYYKNDCSKSKTTTYTIDNVECCCKKNKQTPRCCKKTKKNCCKNKYSSKNAITPNKCCNSESKEFRISSDSFNNRIENFDLAESIIVINEEITVLKLPFTLINKSSVEGYYKCNSPPKLSYDTRIFIQSLQIWFVFTNKKFNYTGL